MAFIGIVLCIAIPVSAAVALITGEWRWLLFTAMSIVILRTSR